MDEKIYNCENWAFLCPQRWSDLQETSDSKIKFCNECQKEVYFCESQEEFENYSQQLFCVAVENPNSIEEDWVTLGVPEIPEHYSKFPLASIILEPTFSLTNNQIIFLVNVFQLKENYVNSRKNLCDGKIQILKRDIPWKVAESISKRLDSKNILHKIEIQLD